MNDNSVKEMREGIGNTVIKYLHYPRRGIVLFESGLGFVPTVYCKLYDHQKKVKKECN